jgi:hypothetical protein
VYAVISSKSSRPTKPPNAAPLLASEIGDAVVLEL